MIDINILLNLLGKSAISTEVDGFLHEIGVKRRPYLTPEDIEEERYNAWLPVKMLGLEFEFRNKNNFNAYAEGTDDSSALILTSLIFYNNREDIRDYESPLPYDLSFKDNPEQVKEKILSHNGKLKRYVRDVFVFDDHYLVVSYNQDRTEIDDISYMLISGRLAPKGKEIGFSSFEELVELLGSKSTDKILNDTFGFIDFKDYTGPKNHSTPRSLAQEYGFTLEFSEYDTPELIGIHLYRPGYLDFSLGYSGELPFGLHFSDSPSVLTKKITGTSEQEEEDLHGNMIWEFENFSLKIEYSTLLNCLYKISVHPSWYWDEDED